MGPPAAALLLLLLLPPSVANRTEPLDSPRPPLAAPATRGARHHSGVGEARLSKFLFLDDSIFASRRLVKSRMNPPAKYGRVIRPEQPWEMMSMGALCVPCAPEPFCTGATD